MNVTTTITLTMTSTEQEHEHKPQRTARAGALVARHPAWVGHHTGGSWSTPTVQRCPKGEAVCGSTTTNPKQPHTTMTYGEPRPLLKATGTHCAYFANIVKNFLFQFFLSFHSDTPQATRSTARRVSQECRTRVVCGRFSFRLALAPPCAVLRLASSSSSRSVSARTDGVFRYVRLPRFAGALFFSGQFVFVYFGDFFQQGSLVWERLVVQPWLQYILFYCLPFLSFYFFPVPPSSVFSVPTDPRCVSGPVVDYIVVIDVSRVRFSAAGRKLTVSCAWMTRTNREVLSVFLGDPEQKHLAKSLSCVAVLMLALSSRHTTWHRF